MPIEAKKEHQIPWNWNHGWVRVTMWVLGLELASSGRAARALHHGAITTASFISFLEKMLLCVSAWSQMCDSPALASRMLGL